MKRAASRSPIARELLLRKLRKKDGRVKRKTERVMALQSRADRSTSDKASAQSSLEYQVQFVLDNLKWLRRADPKGYHERQIEELKHRVFTKTELFPHEVKIIDKAFELVWRGYEMPDAVPTAHVRRRKGLRF